MDTLVERCRLAPASKQELLQFRLEELLSSAAWSGQISLLSDISQDSRVSLQVRNRFVRDWVRENFVPSVLKEMEGFPGPSVEILVTVQENAPARQTPVVGIRPSSEPISKPVPEVPPHVNDRAPSPSVSFQHESLKAKYSFENFVIGGSNQFAHAAAKAVAKLPGRNYNPLFIYGGVGLGKTHLLNAVGLEILKSNPAARIICTSSEKFMNELIYCMRFDKMSDFRKKYRDNCDVLLIDDIQFIAGKERTQEEFFHTFNHLYDAQKQIVLTSDQSPREIPDLEERLRSRFEWGLLADIQTPDLETRIAILKRKADDDGFILDDELALFLASHIKSNVRELEGSLIRLNAFATLNHLPLSIELAKDVLKNVLPAVDRILTVEGIQKIVADFFKIKLVDLTGKRRIRSLALPRQIAMYLCRKHVHSSFPEIGHKFGGKDHSTVVHACSKIENVIQKDPVLRQQVLALENNLSR